MEWMPFIREFAYRVYGFRPNERRKRILAHSRLFASPFSTGSSIKPTKFPNDAQREREREKLHPFVREFISRSPATTRDYSQLILAVYPTIRSYPFNSSAITWRTSFPKLAQPKLGKRESSLAPFLSLFIYVLFARRRERRFRVRNTAFTRGEKTGRRIEEGRMGGRKKERERKKKERKAGINFVRVNRIFAYCLILCSPVSPSPPLPLTSSSKTGPIVRG